MLIACLAAVILVRTRTKQLLCTVVLLLCWKKKVILYINHAHHATLSYEKSKTINN